MREFKIPSTPPTTNKTIRFPNDVIEEVEYLFWSKHGICNAAVRISPIEIQIAHSFLWSLHSITLIIPNESVIYLVSFA